MKHTISVQLSEQGIDRLIKKLDEYERWLQRKTREFVDRLADRGCHLSQIYFSSATYDGVNDVKVHVEKQGENAAAVVAVGNATLFIEFGAGYMMGYGHPEPQGYGPGTYPGQKHAFDPNGWYFKDSSGNTVHSFGNPPAAPMYVTVKDLEMELEKIAREVFV